MCEASGAADFSVPLLLCRRSHRRTQAALQWRDLDWCQGEHGDAGVWLVYDERLSFRQQGDRYRAFGDADGQSHRSAVEVPDGEELDPVDFGRVAHAVTPINDDG